MRDWRDMDAAFAAVEGVSAERDVRMERRTTLRVGGPADLFVRVTRRAALPCVLALLESEGTPWMAIGAGSNLLVTDGGIEGVALMLGGEFGTVDVADEGVAGRATLEAGASAWLPMVVGTAERADLSGLDGLTGIPGTLGGAVVMNAGTRHGELAGSLVDCRIATPAGEAQFAAGALGFAYRTSRLPAGGVVVSARFSLARGRTEADRFAAADIRGNRERVQPPGAGTAGSFFRNPDAAHTAGRLIDGAGLKGLRKGGAVVSPVHANFLSNAGGATASEMLELAETVVRAVRDTTGFGLVPEVRVVGRGAEAWRERLAVAASGTRASEG